MLVMGYGDEMRGRRALTVLALIGLAAATSLMILGIIGIASAYTNSWLLGSGLVLLIASVWLGLHLHRERLLYPLLPREPKDDEDKDPPP